MVVVVVVSDGEVVSSVIISLMIIDFSCPCPGLPSMNGLLRIDRDRDEEDATSTLRITHSSAWSLVVVVVVVSEALPLLIEQQSPNLPRFS